MYAKQDAQVNASKTLSTHATTRTRSPNTMNSESFMAQKISYLITKPQKLLKLSLPRLRKTLKTGARRVLLQAQDLISIRIAARTFTTTQITKLSSQPTQLPMTGMEVKPIGTLTMVSHYQQALLPTKNLLISLLP
jgi:hypothetical protein